MDISITALQVADPPQAWRAAGFRVDDDATCRIGGLRIRLLGDSERRGIVGWELYGDPPLPAEIDGIPTSRASAPAPTDPAPTHPNGVTHIDHLVLMTPDPDRTSAVLAGLGQEPRRERRGELGGAAMRQIFYRFGDLIVEMVGPLEAAPDAADTPAHLWGLTHVADLDTATALLGETAGRPKDAVQPGRRITTLRTRDLGMSVRTALITPHVRRSQVTPSDTENDTENHTEEAAQ